MRTYKYKIFQIIIYSLVTILLAVSIYFYQRQYSYKQVKLNKRIILLDTTFNKTEINELDTLNNILFLWISEKCCHECVEKELKLIEELNFNIPVLIALKPVRKWKINNYYKNWSIELYCIYNAYSFIEQDAIPYYFVYNKTKNTIAHIFFPDKNNKAATLQYLNKIKTLINNE